MLDTVFALGVLDTVTGFAVLDGVFADAVLDTVTGFAGVTQYRCWCLRARSEF